MRERREGTPLFLYPPHLFFFPHLFPHLPFSLYTLLFFLLHTYILPNYFTYGYCTQH